MTKVLFFSLSISVLCTLFTFWRLYRWRGFRLWMTPLPIVALALCFWLPLIEFFHRDSFMRDILSWGGNIWSVMAAFFTGIVLVLEVIRRFLRLYFRYATGEPKDILPARRSVPLALVLVLLLTSYAAYEARDVRVTRLSIQTDKLPKDMNQYRIVYVADIHLNEITGEQALGRITALIKEQNADLLLFGGDIVDYPNMRGRQREAAMLAKPIFPKDGSLAVLGNHEAIHNHIDNSIPFMKRAWMYVMRGEVIVTSAISVVGVDDPAAAEAQSSTMHNPMLLLSRMPQDRFIVLLKHQPDIQQESIGLFDLQLSGHTHGGQIWPARYLVELAYDAPQARLTMLESPLGKSWYYCTNGTGFSRLPLRFLTPPEIVVIDLIR